MNGADQSSCPAIQAIGINKRFGEGQHSVLALDDISLEIQQNGFFTLLGPSGCGKTTLLRLNGVAVEGLPPYQRRINTMFQSYALFPHMTVADNVAFGPRMRNVAAAEIRATVEEMLALVKMSGLASRRTDQLSGGQQQRVALARALANRPEVLLLDESLSALDLKLRQEMRGELKHLQRRTGTTFVFITHDQEEALIRQVTRVSADSIEALSEKLEGVDVAALRAEIAAYNGAVMTDVPFDPTVRDRRGTNGLPVNKSNWANRLDTPPYPAYQVGCGITFTFGGLRIGPDAQVLDADMAPIPGLFAAGELAGGLFYFNYPGGTGLMSGAVFGRLAGTSAAREAR